MIEGRRIACYNDLVAALAARKAELELSDQVLDEVAGLTPGHSGKIFTHERGIGASALEALMQALAVDLVMIPNPDKLAEMQPYYQGRKASFVRTNHRVGNRPLIRVMRELGRKSAQNTSERLGSTKAWSVAANAKRSQKLTKEQRQEIARKAAGARWAKRAVAPS